MGIPAINVTPTAKDRDVSRHHQVDSRRTLAACKRIMQKQAFVFDHAMRNGADNLSINPNLITWARKTKAMVYTKAKPRRL